MSNRDAAPVGSVTKEISMLQKFRDFLSLDNQKLFWFVLFLSLLPLWVVVYPPMVDIPQHAAQISALQQMWAGNTAFTEVFRINWFTPYLMGYLSVYFLALLFPILIAFKIILSLILIAIPVLSGILFREMGADERWKWLVIPSCFGIAFFWGFLNFLVAIPFGLLFLILTVRYDRNASIKNSFLIALYAVFLFFCHVLMLGFFSVLALAYLAGAHYRDLKTMIRRFIPYAAPLPIIALWLVFTYRHESEARKTEIVFGTGLEKLEILLRQISGSQVDFSDYSTIPLSVILGTVIILFPLIVKAQFNRNPKRWFPLAMGTLLFLIFPSSAMGTSILYERFAAFLIPIWFMVWDPPKTKSIKWHWLAITVVCVCALMNMSHFRSFDRDAKNMNKIMSDIGPGKKVLSLMVDRESPDFSYPVFLHCGSWYQVTQKGIVDFNFAYFFPLMVRYKEGHKSKITPGVGHYTDRFQWEKHHGADFDYFIVHADEDMREQLFKEHKDSVSLKTRNGRWWLYERTS